MGSIVVSRYRRTRFWAVHTDTGELICVCVYRRGALEVARRLEAGFSYRLSDAQLSAEPTHETGPMKLPAPEP